MASHVVGERLWPPPKQLSAELTANAFICHLPKVSVTDTQDTAEVDKLSNRKEAAGRERGELH